MLALEVNQKFADSFAAAFGQLTKIDRESDLEAWGRVYCPHYFTSPSSDLHKWFGQRLSRMHDERGTKLVVEGPRGSAKSTYAVTLDVLFAACEQREMYINIFADSGDQARRHLESVARELSVNPKIQDRYPDAARCGSWNKSRLELANGCVIECAGSEAAVRGRRSGERRPSHIVLDDPESDDSVYSSITRERVRDWFMRGVLNLGDPETNYVVVGTRVHSDCLTAFLSRQPGWEHKVFKAIVEWPEDMALWAEWETLLGDPMDEARNEKALEFYQMHRLAMDKGAAVLWPDHESLYSLMVMRAMNGHAAFAAEKMNDPVDPSKCEWSPDNFSDPSKWFKDWPTGLLAECTALDPSKGKTDHTGDYQAMCRVGVDANHELWVECEAGHVPSDEMVDKFVTFSRDANCAVIEADCWQELLQKDVKEAAKKQGVLTPFEPILTQGVPKAMRVRRLGPYITRGRVHYRKNSGTNLLVKQLQEFPNGEHDDGPDSFEMALRSLARFTGSKSRNFAKGGFF